jgi:membrane fusion protein, multidrug efflux system
MNIKHIIVAISMSIILITGCSKKKAAPAVQTVPVTVGTVTQKDVPVEISDVGNVQAYSTNTVFTQVAGLLNKAYIKEGQDVKAGELLFTIDPTPFEIALRKTEATLDHDIALNKQAIATLNKDSAQLINAKVETQRYANLIKDGVVDQEDYDSTRTNSEALEATVQADIAMIKSTEETIRSDKTDVENAKVQLGYCTIRSPMDGRAGSFMIYPGNVIQNSVSPLLAINQIVPIYVTFAVPEQDLPRIKQYMALNKLVVEAMIPNDEKNPIDGELVFVDNQVDQTTGTIKLRASFPNKDRRLWPGLYVKVAIKLTTEPHRLVIPDPAVQVGQQGQYVFVVKSDKSVEVRPITVERTFQQDDVISKGLSLGETVVTDGQLRLVSGAKVDISTTGASTTGTSSKDTTSGASSKDTTSS